MQHLLPIPHEGHLGFRCWRGPGRKMPVAHTHLEIEANFLSHGAIAYLFGGQRVDVGAGELVIFWGSVPHQLIVLEETSEICWLTLPLSRFLGWDLPTALTQSLLDGQILKQIVGVERDAFNFACWERDLNDGDAGRMHVVELEMHARLCRFSLDIESDAPLNRPASRGELGHVEKMAAFMARNYRDPIGIEDVAKSADIHPNYAMNLFKRGFGLSIGEFVNRTRLAQVQRLLVTSDRKVLDIAFDCGFGSASQFHAAFKKRCGQSPVSYRKELQQSQKGASPFPRPIMKPRANDDL